MAEIGSAPIIPPDPQNVFVGPGSTAGSANVAWGESNNFNFTLPAGQGGFAVFYLDALSLDATQGTPTGDVYTTNNNGAPNLSEIVRLTNDLHSRSFTNPYPTVVLMRSIGATPLAPMGGQPGNNGLYNSAYASALDNLATETFRAGGHSQLLYRMATAPQTSNGYALVGNNYSVSEGHGTDAGTGSATPSIATLSGTLARDKGALYRLRHVANTQLTSGFSQVLAQEPSAWPVSSTTGQKAALSCIGNQLELGPNPRAAYWISTFSEARWEEIQLNLGRLTASSCSSSNVSATDFNAVQAELSTEIGWLIQAHNYVEATFKPFSSAGGALSSYTELQTITNDVKTAITPPAATVGVDWFSIFTDVVFAIGTVAGATEGGPVGAEGGGAPIGPAVGIFGQVLSIAGTLFAGLDDAPVVNDWKSQVIAESDQLGQELVDQFTALSTNEELVFDIVAADYQKLKTVGTLGGCVGGPGCTPEWQLTQNDVRRASQVYLVNSQREIWGGLLPTAFPYVLAVNSNPSGYNGTHQGSDANIGNVACGFEEVFVDYTLTPPDSLGSPRALQTGIVEPGNTNFLVMAARSFKGYPSGPTPFPKLSLLNTPSGVQPPFKNVTGDDLSGGGLGIDPYQMMIDSWPYIGSPGNTRPARTPWLGC